MMENDTVEQAHADEERGYWLGREQGMHAVAQWHEDEARRLDERAQRMSPKEGWCRSYERDRAAFHRECAEHVRALADRS
jgi:hypothetical protein